MMKMKTHKRMKLTVILLCSIALSACATWPAETKVEMKPRLVNEDVKRQDYRTLAWYWDDHAKKHMIDWKGASFLTIREPEHKAEITIGNGPYFGMIELVGQPDGSTQVLSYSWGDAARIIEQWRQLILMAPERK